MSAAPFIPVSLADYERLGLERLDANARAYLEGGAADEITVRENRAAFDRLRLTNRVLRDMRAAHTRLTLLGLDLDHPILIAPTAFHKLAHPEGEIATVQGAGAARALLVASTQSSVTLEEIARAARAPLWFQLYVQPDRALTLHLARRAAAAGYAGLVVTVDAPVSLRNREQRAGFRLPPGIAAANLRGAPGAAPCAGRIGDSPLFSGALAGAPDWSDIAHLRAQWRAPLLLKGILDPDDARRAIDAGVDGLIVSNHGGRVLDTLPATIEALPALAEAVAGRVPLILDGGIRRGTDILKALALGAAAIMVGRPCLHALAAGGAPGVAHMIHLLRAELEVAMTLTGCPTLADIDRAVLWRAPG